MNNTLKIWLIVLVFCYPGLVSVVVILALSGMVGTFLGLLLAVPAFKYSLLIFYGANPIALMLPITSGVLLFIGGENSTIKIAQTRNYRNLLRLGCAILLILLPGALSFGFSRASHHLKATSEDIFLAGLTSIHALWIWFPGTFFVFNSFFEEYKRDTLKIGPD